MVARLMALLAPTTQAGSPGTPLAVLKDQYAATGKKRKKEKGREVEFPAIKEEQRQDISYGLW